MFLYILIFFFILYFSIILFLGNNLSNQNKVVEGHGFEPWNPKEQIYSLPRLTTSLTLQKKDGAENRNWTRNLLITSQLLYLLSYFGK